MLLPIGRPGLADLAQPRLSCLLQLLVETRSLLPAAHPGDVRDDFGRPVAPAQHFRNSFRSGRRFDTPMAECYSRSGLNCQSGSQTSGSPEVYAGAIPTIANFNWFNLKG
jgi:hypothetical protein